MKHGGLLAEKPAIQKFHIFHELLAPDGAIFRRFATRPLFAIRNATDGSIQQIRQITLIIP
jgi:hypothetical protein